MLSFALTIFSGAFLLFQVQPLIGKYILPWFGGSPNVWTTCMLFFQTLLLAGYAYAHFSTTRLKPKTQALLHIVLLVVALLLMPITPSESWKEHLEGNPTVRVLLLLSASVGLPYLVLSATGPLLQSWFGQVRPGVSPYRLYALSNVGSLLALLILGLLIGVQSQCLYSSVARLPVALALLAFNTYPLWAALWDRLFYGRTPDHSLMWAMPMILLGLALALDVLGASSGLGSSAQWAQMGSGVAFALTAAAVFGGALVVTQHHTQGLDGRVRTLSSLTLAGLMAVCIISWQGGPHLPHSVPGWWGLALLSFLYGTAFTLMFTVLPRLGVVGNSAIMNMEPVFALVLAWPILGQAVAPIQLLGALLVVGAVVGLGLRKSSTTR